MKRRRKASSHTNLTIKANFHIKEEESQFSHLFDSTQWVVVEFIGNQEEETTQQKEERRKASFHTCFTRLNGWWWRRLFIRSEYTEEVRVDQLVVA